MLKKLNILLHRIKTPSSLGVIVLVLVLIALLYWFQYRPADIRKECHLKATGVARELYRSEVYDPPGEPTELEKIYVEKGRYRRDTYSGHYEICLHAKGLK